MQTQHKRRLPELHLAGRDTVSQAPATIDQVTLPPVLSCGFLSPEKTQSILAIQSELADAWSKRQVFRTETEMVVSVLNDAKHPTPASKYWQCVREQTVMLDNLAIVGFDYRRNEVALKRHYKKLEEATDELDREEIQIDIDECLFKKASMEQNANDRAREILLWSSLKEDLDDGTFNTKDVNAHQMESLHYSLINRSKGVGPQTAPAEMVNILGPLETIERIKRGD